MSHELYVEADVAETSRISGCPKFWSFQFLSQAEKVKLTNRLRISWLSVRLPWEVQTSWIPQRLCWSQLGFGVLFSIFTLANTWTEDRGQQPLLGGANPIWIGIGFVYMDHRSSKLSTLCFSPVKCHLRLTMSHEEFLPFWVVWLINLEFHWGLIKWARFQNKKCLCLWAHALFLDIYSIYTTILHIYIYSNFFVW